MALLQTNPTEEPQNVPTATVITIGPWDGGEFALVQTTIKPSLSWHRCDDCETVVKLLSDYEWTPEFMLIAQPLPGGVSQEQVELLRQTAPLAQIVIVAGSWCEGELRTGHPPEGVLRMYWHEFANWWPTHIESKWSAFLDGPLAARSSHVNIANEHSGTAAIYTPSLASFEALASTLALAGLDARWIRKTDAMPDDAAIGIWDGGQLNAEELVDLQAFGSGIRTRGGKLVALLDYPRKQHIEFLQQLGCQAILGKPYVIEELLAACTS
jgi:hypothetical protein